jgi:hypothetical protein
MRIIATLQEPDEGSVRLGARLRGQTEDSAVMAIRCGVARYVRRFAPTGANDLTGAAQESLQCRQVAGW